MAPGSTGLDRLYSVFLRRSKKFRKCPQWRGQLPFDILIRDQIMLPRTSRQSGRMLSNDESILRPEYTHYSRSSIWDELLFPTRNGRLS